MWMERAQQGAFRICRSTADIRAFMVERAVAAILHMEGAEAIDETLTFCTFFTPSWRAPSAGLEQADRIRPWGALCVSLSPDTGPGLTDAGKRLVLNATRCGSAGPEPPNEQGFTMLPGCQCPLVRHPFQRPCPHPFVAQPDRPTVGDGCARQAGWWGLNFSVSFLRADGRRVERPAGTPSCATWITCGQVGEDSPIGFARITKAAPRPI